MSNQIDIDSLTIGQAKALVAMLQGQQQAQQPPEPQSTAFEIGKKYFIRTATYHGTGRLIAIYPQELVLEDAAWIADSGRFSNALKTGDYSEIEPFHAPWIVSRGGIVDATEITTELPRTAK